MRILIFLILSLTLTPLTAEKPEKRDPLSQPLAGEPWLGIHTIWMEKATAAQLKGVPQGFGLLVDAVESQSPASEAGLQPLDILWKYNDQLIANAGQLFALMKLTGISNEGVLTISRRGESLTLPVVIGRRPDSRKELAEAATEVLMPPLPGAIVRQLDLGKRSGFISEGEVTVSLTRISTGFEYSVSEGAEVVKQGLLPDGDPSTWPATIDEKNRRKLAVLFQSLENAEQREAPRPRLPRVRRVPVPIEKEKK